jgi:hypothetical protein
MWYGFDMRQFKSGLLVFVAIGVLAALLGVISGFFSESETKNYWALLFLLLAIPFIWLILSSVFFSTWVKVEGNTLSWYLYKILRLKTVTVDEIERIRGGSFSAVIIETRRGNIHIVGLMLPHRVALSDHLQKLNPAIVVGPGRA